MYKYWSPVNNPIQKPIGWWYHKILCELGYFIEMKISTSFGSQMYYNHLDFMIDKYGFNLYGDRL